MPAEAGIQSGGLNNLLLGPRFRGDDEKEARGLVPALRSSSAAVRHEAGDSRFDLGLALAHRSGFVHKLPNFCA
jgi:hypothetical protein